jgi:hypothetical protein
LVEHYSKSTAAQLSASEIEQDGTSSHLDDNWKHTNLIFRKTWAIRILDLDVVLIQATMESQEWIWLTWAIAPMLILSMSISQFEASEKLTGLAFGPTYQKAPFSPSLTTARTMLFALIKHSFFFKPLAKLKDRKPPLPPPAHPSGTPSDPKAFIGRDGKEHS